MLGTLLQQPGECTALGCTVADLTTGAVLTVPPNALASGVKYRFAVSGLATLPTACGTHSVVGKTLVGSSNNTRTDCGAPPCAPPGFAIGPSVQVPIQQNLEYQLSQGESLALRYCDSTLGWRTPATGPTTGSVQNNSYLAGRKAAGASGVDTLRLYGVMFDDADHDDVRDTCDCSPGSATLWSAPGPAGDMTLSGQGATPTTLTWALPGCPGGATNILLYDTIRSTNRADFVNNAVCVESNGTDTTSTDAQNPPLGQAFYYIISPENGCAAGSVCLLPACVQISARDC